MNSNGKRKEVRNEAFDETDEASMRPASYEIRTEKMRLSVTEKLAR